MPHYFSRSLSGCIKQAPTAALYIVIFRSGQVPKEPKNL